MSQYSVEASFVDASVVGNWRIYARRPGHASVEITFVRGVPTGLGGFSFTDPFGAEQASLSFPKITLWDTLGVGDLSWLTKDTDIDIVWDGPLPAGYPGRFAWEGFAISFDYSTGKGLTVGLKGAMHQLDNYLAKPEYPTRPLPYEWAIANQWAGRPDLRLRPLKVVFPPWWTTKYVPPARDVRTYMIPTHVKSGQNWTGLTTRQTGSFEAVLTSYIQTLLSSMYTERGRWALDLDRYRSPVLRHRDTPNDAGDAQLVIDPATPGVECSFNIDWSQSLNVAFGQGTSLAGEGYTGQIITHDGSRTTYEPLAALRQVHPVEDGNGWLDPSVMRKEVLLQVQQGLNLTQARTVGAAHLARFGDPGVTGSITLTVDPKMGNDYLPRALIKAGMNIRLPQVFGSSTGLLLHITQVTTDLANGTTTLSVDSKFRDALTVEEVKIRGRDALSVSRQLIGGQYSPPVPDLLLPWNYAEGSGYIPHGSEFSCKRLFDGMPEGVLFPWTEWTTQRPPKDPSWRRCYMGIPAKHVNADFNWSVRYNRDGIRLGLPVKMAQAGQIRQLQIAAYDRDGNLFPVKFHVSFYTMSGVNVYSMPRITPGDLPTADGYAVGQHYPFFANAWERYRTDGTQITTEDPVAVASAALVRAYGTRNVPAGYWPGSKEQGTPPTGMLVDDGVWEFDTQANVGLEFNQFTPQQAAPDVGHLYCMIYCDSQGADEVYFMGRMFRVEPGATV